MEPVEGTQLPARVGPYEIVARLAMGGMAELLLGRRLGPSGFMRTLAIKRILPHLAADPSFRSMFLDEARLAAMIQHPNVVRVEDLGEDGDSYYMAMEYLQGDTANALLRARDTPLPATVVAYVVAECAAGLHAAHTLRDPEGNPLHVVHRDVTPHNIFVTFDGRVKVIDFGVAHAAQRVSHTQSGVIKGKFAYMSPEQLVDQRVDHRSDQFSLGVVLFELLTRKRLFAKSSQGATVHAVVSKEAPPPSALHAMIPPELDAICVRALSKDPAARFPSCEAMREALMTYLGSTTNVGDEQQALAAEMMERFADQREAREALGTGASDVAGLRPRSEPTAPSVHRRPPTRRPWKVVVPILAIAVAAGAALALWPGEPPPAPAAEPAAPAPIFLEISSEPPGARVTLEDGATHHTPARIERAPHDEPVTVVLELDGHEPWSREVRLDVSQRIHATLARSPLEPQPLEPEAEEEPEEVLSAAQRARREERRRLRRERRERAQKMAAIPIWD